MASKQRYPKICLLVTGTRNFGSSIRARDEYGNNKHLYETYFGPIESSFNVMENQFPEMDTLHEYDVFILTGSTARISLEKKEWIDNLLDMIGLIIRLNKVLFGLHDLQLGLKFGIVSGAIALIITSSILGIFYQFLLFRQKPN